MCFSIRAQCGLVITATHDEKKKKTKSKILHVEQFENKFGTKTLQSACMVSYRLNPRIVMEKD